jgi:phosphate transport system substrate-binding protein
MLLLILPSCAPTKKEEEKGKEKVKIIRISGSKTCLPLMKILASEFEKKNPNYKIQFLPGAHSRAGIKGVAQGILDVGAVSRRLKPEEKALGVKYYCLSSDGLAVGVSKNIHLKNITSEEIRKIYRGEITNWKEIGGPDAPIVVLDRNEDESAKIILRQYILGKDLKITEKAVKLYFESDMINALIETPNAIGYFSLGYALSEKIPVNILSLNNVEPNIKNIKEKKYEMVRPLGVIVKGNEPEVQKFLNFILSEEAKKIMEEAGFAPCLSR